MKSTNNNYFKVYSNSNISRNYDYISKDNLNNDNSWGNSMKPYIHKRKNKKFYPEIGYKTQKNKMIIEYAP